MKHGRTCWEIVIVSVHALYALRLQGPSITRPSITIMLLSVRISIVMFAVLVTVYFLPHNDLTVDGFSFSALKTRHKRPITSPITTTTKLVRKAY